METIKAKVAELYELRALLLGFQNEGAVIYTGFVNEKGVNEGTKRIANKAARVIGVELEAISKQRVDLSADKDLTEDEKKEKDKQILEDEVEFQTELVDFNKVENLSLSMNYEFLYKKLFTNY